MTVTNKLYYGDYLRLDDLLSIQSPKSDEVGFSAHDEMLFIIVHQTYELWFKQILFELQSIRSIFNSGPINDNSPEMEIAVHRLKRVCEIWKHLVNQIGILETMTPLDFLDFRKFLVPASGFQSYQYRQIEAMLGLKIKNRYASSYYLSEFKDEHVNLLKIIETDSSIVDLIEKWLLRFPFFENRFWTQYESKDQNNGFWKDYQQLYTSSLAENDNSVVRTREFNMLFQLTETTTEQDIERIRINQAALFIMLYREYPLLQQPFKLLENLIEIDELMSNWRYKHLNMVKRMIGSRMGTMGTTGAEYLEKSSAQNNFFSTFSALSNYLIERRKLPKLPLALIEELSFITR